MLLSRFTGLMLFFLGIFLIPAGTAQACEMHQQTAKAAKENKDQPGTDKKMDCCKQHSAKHQHKKGNCDDNNCTNNNCHPMSVSSLHVATSIEVAPPLKAGKAYVIKPNDHQLTAYSYTIWQPPRAS